jgi:glucose-6-phosphate isomerase
VASDSIDIPDTFYAYDIFSDKLHDIINTISPEKTIIIPAKKVIREPWVTKGIMKSSHTLDKLYRKTLTKSNDHLVNTTFRIYRNKFNKLKTIAKLNYYHEVF